MFIEVNPDKGTETNNDVDLFNLSVIAVQFIEVNPDKGTETVLKISDQMAKGQGL